MTATCDRCDRIWSAEAEDRPRYYDDSEICHALGGHVHTCHLCDECYDALASAVAADAAAQQATEDAVAARIAEAAEVVVLALGAERVEIQRSGHSYYVHCRHAAGVATVRISDHAQPAGGSYRVRQIGGLQFAGREVGDFAAEYLVDSADDELPDAADIRRAVAGQIRRERQAARS